MTSNSDRLSNMTEAFSQFLDNSIRENADIERVQRRNERIRHDTTAYTWCVVFTYNNFTSDD